MEDNTITVSSSPTTSVHVSNAQIIANPPKFTEEGELSASENDDLAASQYPNPSILPAAPLNKGTSVVEKGTTAHINKRKGTEKNRVPFVISFSDDESGSDSEEYKNGSAMESDVMTRGAMENRKLSASLVNSQPQKVIQTTNTNRKSPKKLSSNCTFVSSVNKVNGTKFKNGGSTHVGVKSHLKKANSPSIIKFGQNVHINSNKLQDLRQLIAIRENELKSKAGKLGKEVASNSKLNLKSIGRNFTVEPKEQEKKRLKVSEPPRNAVISVGQQDRTSSESTVAAGITSFVGQHGTSAIENDDVKGRFEGKSCDKEILRETVKEMKNYDTPLPSGSGIIRNNMQHNNITYLGESSEQLMAKTDQPLPRQGSLTNSSFWNHFGAATGEIDIKSLLELEELQDKELDEAQEHRRKCEIEERNALKAYRRAQRALAEANTRCSYLYHKRILFSANLRSHVMEDSNMFWSNTPHQHVDSINLQVQNPNFGVSEPLEEEKTNDVGSSLHENSSNYILTEDEQTSAFGLKPGESGLDSHGEGICMERNNEIINNSDTNEDSLLLEATLRSQLFARLGNRTSKKNQSGQSMETVTVEREDGEIMEDSGTKPSSEMAKDQIYDFGDTVMSEQLASMKDHCDYGSFLTEPILKSVFDHAKYTAMDISMQSHAENTQIHTDDIVSGKKVTDSASSSLLDLNVGEDGSYSNNLPVNPFWPHCLFELRGKCNNDVCPWQHVRDYTSKNIDSNSNDCGSLCLAPPTYLVCLDGLKVDLRPYKYLVAQTVEQRWQKCFSASLVVSSSVLADLNSDELCLHGPETCIQIHGVWDRQTSYFHGQNVKKGQPNAHIYQSLETAFLYLRKEVSKQKGHRESLIVLARALEEHPTSVLLWIVYLHIYYSNQKSIGKDDLFRYAIEHNESSYELWLMFINSREKLNDRLIGYNNAISALCRDSSAPDRDIEVDSACILDLFLQLINCLYSSGQVNNGIQSVCALLSSSNRSNNGEQSLPDIQKHLTMSDRCVLWICSIYLLMYKKLPDTVIQQFECQKELPVVEWYYSVHLTDDEKQEAVTLIEYAIEDIDRKSYPDKRTAISTQRFAVNLIRCTAVLKGFDACKDLLKNYIRLYPSCLELTLLSIRVNGFKSTGSTIAAFEEALSRWVGEHGIQCVWNQYAEYALESGKVDFTKEIMERWFDSISEIHKSKTGVLDTSAWISCLNQTDIVFGLINLSLLKKLQNNHTEARIAIEQALEVASSDDYNHCVKEHAVFLLKKDFGFGKAHLPSFLSMMNRYLTDIRAPPSPEPLSRCFIKKIEKPKIQKFVNNLLSSVSSDSCLLNLVLESCFGSSLLPSQTSEDVIELAEGLMEMKPANYRLALCICKNQASANASIRFWASMQLIDSLFQAIPVAPESVWVEAAGLLKNLAGSGFGPFLVSFHKRALSVYPFSMSLWKSYSMLYDADDDDNANKVIAMARAKGIKV